MTHPTTHGLQDRVEAAVSQALAKNEPVSRTALVSRFFGKGASRAQLYRWVNSAIEDAAVATAGAHRMGRPVCQVVEALSGDICTGPLQERVEIPDGRKPIPFMQIVKQSLRDLDRLKQLAYCNDGSVRNVPALLAAINGEGRLLARAATMRAMWVDAQAQIKFLQEIADSIMALPPEHRDPLLAKIAVISDAVGVTLDRRSS